MNHPVRCFTWLSLAASLLLASCFSSGGGGGGAAGEGGEFRAPSGGGTGTCASVCANLRNQCSSEYFNTNCEAGCALDQQEYAAEGQSALFQSLLSCCATVSFPPTKCDEEGIAEVGFEDCDDDDTCGYVEGS